MVRALLHLLPLLLLALSPTTMSQLNSNTTTTTTAAPSTQTFTFPATLPLLRPLNVPPSSPPTALPFTLSIPPHTDLWRKPYPLAIASNQPSYYHSVPLARLLSAKVRVTLWAQGGGVQERVLYDQAGIVLLFATKKMRTINTGDADADAESDVNIDSTEAVIQDRWIKAGVEYEPNFGGPKQSVVVTREWSDWSVSDVAPANSTDTGELTLTAEIYREQLKPEQGGGLGSSLFVRVNGQVAREVTWGYAQDDIVSAGEALHAWVGVYGARPIVRPGKEGDELRVRVEEVEVVTVLGG